MSPASVSIAFYLLAVLDILACTATDDRLGIGTILDVKVLVLRKIRVAALFLALALTMSAAHTTHTTAHTTGTGATGCARGHATAPGGGR
ncbi:hypothetical protein ACT17_12755 [Mycolicibacterium conceptionense]|uniref:Secreted protein n=2 Tax=Mycolicibacterium TaxID=1866885 RepID=A0ABR5FXZ1_9MYCO|nr:hypothetical protein AA982_23635 [Mycolicibacterium senegalense]KMV18164.1 hypothetical protein ACT17_12755 [Mycolicibacterium conceptionense]KLO52744.1 hypothetical protein ABW05_15730 [Mycolicibacterium senegalense]OBK03480.1 hypothetical protein A5639_23170 [Mycolicibacterium conceptionense]OMB70349.1 hypothetical protein A5741_07810 [Mycolicibacterium conceptionense]